MSPTADDYEAAAQEVHDEDVELTLYVNGASDLSARAIANARRLCDSAPGGPYRLSLLDVAEHTGSLRSSQIVAVPTLVRTKPLPERRVVGDLSESERVLGVLGLPTMPVAEA